MNSPVSLLKNELEKNRGILRMMPVWLARTSPPGRRLKLHPDDLYSFGADKGAICERLFCCSGIPGSGGIDDESTMSRFCLGKNEHMLFPEAIKLMGNELLGRETMKEYGAFKMFAKFFDPSTALPMHIHPHAKYAEKIGMKQKPEAYYFPVELNSITHGHDYTFFGLIEGTTKEEFLECIRNFNKGENYVLTLSKAYKIKLGTGWLVPAGLLHAPASVVTYEPQVMSDPIAFYQNLIDSKYTLGSAALNTMIPEDFKGDRDEYLLEMIDWEGNLVDFHKNYYHAPIPVKSKTEMADEGYYEEWITYGSEDFSAKRLSVLPGRTVTIKDSTAYGFIMMQGYGRINGVEINTPSIIRFGQQTADEAFVVEPAAKEGVVIENLSQFSEIVMLKHFNSDNKEWRNVHA